LNLARTLSARARIGVRVPKLGLTFSTTSILKVPVRDLKVAEQNVSSPTLVVGRPNAAASDRSIVLTGVHGSIRAPVSYLLVPVSRTTTAVGMICTLRCCNRDATDGAALGASNWSEHREWFRELCVGFGERKLEAEGRGDVAEGRNGETDRCRELEDSCKWSSVWWSCPHFLHVSPLRHTPSECWWPRQFAQYLLLITARSRFSVLSLRKRLHFRRGWIPRQTRQR